MSIYTLTRNTSDQTGTFGQLSDSTGQVLCFTCELPWDDNAPDKSCIPKGMYPCINYSSAKFPNVWQVTNVSGRSDILIHNGNEEQQTDGCILVGDSMGIVNGLPAVLNSVKTLAYLKTTMPDLFTLTITGIVG